MYIFCFLEVVLVLFFILFLLFLGCFWFILVGFLGFFLVGVKLALLVWVKYMGLFFVFFGLLVVCLLVAFFIFWDFFVWVCFVWVFLVVKVWGMVLLIGFKFRLLLVFFCNFWLLLDCELKILDFFKCLILFCIFL